MISNQGVELDPSKIKAISDIPPFFTHKQAVMRFCGMVKYLYAFCPHKSGIMNSSGQTLTKKHSPKQSF